MVRSNVMSLNQLQVDSTDRLQPATHRFPELSELLTTQHVEVVGRGPDTDSDGKISRILPARKALTAHEGYTICILQSWC